MFSFIYITFLVLEKKRAVILCRNLKLETFQLTVTFQILGKASDWHESSHEDVILQVQLSPLDLHNKNRLRFQ